MDKNAVCYISTGFGLGEKLNVEALIECVTGAETGAIETVKTRDYWLDPEGVAEIRADVEGGVNTILLVGRSARGFSDPFGFGNDVIIEYLPLCELVVWPMEDSYEGEEEAGEDRQMAAEDYLRMYCAKLKVANFKEPYQLEQEGVYKGILVVGAGVTGMAAALHAAKAGNQVCLVEKEAELGGFLGKMAKLAPQSPPYTELEDTGLAETVAAIEADENIKVFTGTTVEKTKGAPGNFDVTLSNGETIQAGAIIQATGWTPYDPENLKDDLAYGTSGVITNVQMEEKAKAGDLGGLNAVAFVQCAGSRDENHLPYCSAFCCMATMKQAIYVKKANPEAAVFVVYKDIRTPEQGEEVYREAQRQGVVFLRRPEDVYPTITESGGKLTLETKDTLIDEDITLEELDLVVLATGMKPNNPKVVDMPLIPFDMPDTEGKKLTAEAKSQCDTWSVLNLDYRQGPNLPTIAHAMPDSHFICFPYETRRTGIYTAGTVRRPMRVTQAQEDAAGAVLKAMQAIRGADFGFAVHPRSLDESFPEFAMQRCTQCKRCTEECPFGAINEDEKANPLPNITRCRRCGTCMGACPERIIGFKDYNINMINSMIKAVEIPEEDDEKPRILVLACENDAIPALEMAAQAGLKLSPWFRFIPVRCLGSVNLIWIADSMSAGYDGVMLWGCRHGDDYQCHFVKGSELANVRMSKIAETLDRLMLESDRVKVEEVAINDSARVPQIMSEFMELIDELGPNPMKGF